MYHCEFMSEQIKIHCVHQRMQNIYWSKLPPILSPIAIDPLRFVRYAFVMGSIFPFASSLFSSGGVIRVLGMVGIFLLAEGVRVSGSNTRFCIPNGE